MPFTHPLQTFGGTGAQETAGRGGGDRPGTQRLCLGHRAASPPAPAPELSRKAFRGKTDQQLKMNLGPRAFSETEAGTRSGARLAVVTWRYPIRTKCLE